MTVSTVSRWPTVGDTGSRSRWSHSDVSDILIITSMTSVTSLTSLILPGGMRRHCMKSHNSKLYLVLLLECIARVCLFLCYSLWPSPSLSRAEKFY